RLLAFPMRTSTVQRAGQRRGLPVPVPGLSTHARVFDHAGPTGARDGAPAHIAFRCLNGVGTRSFTPFAAQWLACALPYRRFTTPLADCGARLGADVVRYSFIATDSHRLVLAGWSCPYQTAHSCPV